MLRRMAMALAVVASLLIAALPAAAATETTAHYQLRGSGLSAVFSNAGYDDSGSLAPGDYFETYIDAAASMSKADGSWTPGSYVCVGHNEFTVDADGNSLYTFGFQACGEATTLTIDKGLSGGHVVATFRAEECVAWDEFKNCTESNTIGDVAVNLTLSGIGSIERWHGTSSEGTAGTYQYTAHGTGTSRSADASGSVTLNGVSLTTGATGTAGWMFESKRGMVEISHG